MMTYSRLAIALAVFCISPAIFAGAPATGPVVEGFGPVMEPPEGAYNLLPGITYRARLDVSRTGELPTQRNRSLESAARFLNMHAQRGIDPKNMAFALVVHGPATKDLLTDRAYRARYGEDNPNTALLQALGAAGVEIYLCAQSAAFNTFEWSEFSPAATIAVSAMTAHVRLDSEGYAVIPF